MHSFTVIILVCPFILLILPANFFDSGQSLCLSKSLLNLECLGCGITRAIQHLIHFEFKEAWILNKLAYVLLPVFIYLWIKEVIKVYSFFKIKH
jgi:hypothetical protein